MSPRIKCISWAAILVLPLLLLLANVQADERLGCNGIPTEIPISVEVGRGDNLDQLQLRAEASAERKVLEQGCGSFIASTTRLDHSKVVDDSVVQASHGLI